MASMITFALYNIIDTFWVAKLGHEAIAALTIVLPFHILIIAIGVGSGIGINSLTSRLFGENDTKAANHTAGQIFIITIFFGGVFLVPGALFPHPILVLLGGTPDIMDYATQYLVIISFGAPCLFFTLVANNLLRGSGDAVRPMIFMLIATSLNIILDPLMIFGIGPFPEMGVRGAALATTISQIIGAGLSFIYLMTKQSAYRIKLSFLKPDFSILRSIYAVGLPSMIIEITESLTFALFNNVLSLFGSLALAAAGIAIRISDLAFMPIFGVSHGLLPIIGFNFGARIWKRLWGAVKIASIGLLLLMSIATILLEIFTPGLISIFSSNAELIAIAVPAMRIILSTLIFVGPSILFITTFQGLSKGKEVLILSLTRQFIFFVPALYLLPQIMGINGIWLSVPISDVLGFLVSGAWLLREYRMQKRAGTWSDINIQIPM
jgi:putative MATE family efflux protein